MPHKVKPPPWEHGDGLGSDTGEPCLARSEPDCKRLLDDLVRAREHLERRTEALAIIADWRDDLMVRVDRARLRYELIGLPEEEQQALEDEVAAFKHCCRVLAWNPNAKANGRAAA